MASKLKTFIFIGRSGSGKGTQVELLIKKLKEENPDTPVYYMQTGESFREFIKGNSYSSRRAREIIEAGQRVHSFSAIRLWANNFVENLNGNEHIIIDGSPR